MCRQGQLPPKSSHAANYVERWNRSDKTEALAKARLNSGKLSMTTGLPTFLLLRSDEWRQHQC